MYILRTTRMLERDRSLAPADKVLLVASEVDYKSVFLEVLLAIPLA